MVMSPLISKRRRGWSAHPQEAPGQGQNDGTSKNAVLIQIWTALIAYLLLVWVKFKTKAGWGLLELTRLAQTMLLERMDLWALLGLRTPDNRQPLLFN
jgi:hypothetical protein